MRQKHQAQSGFVLVSVLWILVIMVVASSAFSIWVDRVREQASLRQQHAETYRRSTDALTKVVYTYLTGHKTSDGVSWPGSGGAKTVAKFDSLDDFMAGAAAKVVASEAGFMRLDGSVLDIGDGIRIMVQDRGGLIGLSLLADKTIFASLAAQAKNQISTERLADTLLDYQDPDGIRRGQGAEEHDYRRELMPPPMNGYLRSPLQLRSIVDWDVALKARDDAWILRVFRNEGNAVVNVNTAYVGALRLILNNEKNIQTILTSREQQPFSRVSDLTKFTGGTEELLFSTIPAAGFRFWWWHQGDTTAHVYDVQFSPLDSGANAWYFNWTARVTLPDDLAQSTAKAIDHPFFR
jgi:hypothetical protein